MDRKQEIFTVITDIIEEKKRTSIYPPIATIEEIAEKTENYVPILDFGILKAYDLMNNKFKMSDK
jgi:hypothetical protein